MADYNLFPMGPQALWIERPDDLIWQSVLESHACLDSVFSFEQQTHASFEGQRIDAYVERGRVRQLMRSPHLQRTTTLPLTDRWNGAWQRPAIGSVRCGTVHGLRPERPHLMCRRPQREPDGKRW